MLRRVLLQLVAVFSLAGIFALLVGASAGRVPAGFGQLIRNQDAKSRGCQDDSITGLDRETPGWVSVNASDAQVIVEGVATGSQVTSIDFPFSHDSHDVNWYVTLDDKYQHLNSDANHVVNGKPNMEMEWESKYFPMAYWPVENDRIWLRGRHIFDCGHPPYRTEIHPGTISVATRYQPYQFGLEVNPSHANLTYIYAGGQGGYYTERVAGQDYYIQVPLPGKPSPNAVLETRVLSASNPPPILRPLPEIGKLEIRLPFANVADPGRRWWLYDWITKVRLAIVRGQGRPAFDRPKNNFSYGAIVASRWKEPVVSTGFRLLRVTYESFKVHNDHDNFSGEWNMYTRTNGVFQKVPEKEVDDGDTITINHSTNPIVAENRTLVVSAHGWEDDYDSYFGVGMPPGVFDLGASNSNESLGKVKVEFGAGQNFGIGRHAVKSSSGDYTLNFRIEEVKRIPAGASNVREAYVATIKSILVADPAAKTPTMPLDLTLTLQEGRVTKSINATVGQSTPLAGVAVSGTIEAGTPTLTFMLETQLPALIKNRGSKLPPEIIPRPIKIRKPFAPGVYREVVMSEGASSVEFEISIAKSARVRPELLDRLGKIKLTPATGVKPPAGTRRPPSGGGATPIRPPAGGGGGLPALTGGAKPPNG